MAHCYNILTFILILPVLLALKQDLESKSKDLTNYEHEFEDGSHFTNTWAVEFNPELSHDEITSFAQKHGFIHYGEVSELYHMLEMFGLNIFFVILLFFFYISWATNCMSSNVDLYSNPVYRETINSFSIDCGFILSLFQVVFYSGTH